MKKILLFCLSLCLCMNLFLSSMTAFAAEVPSFSVGAVKHGETVTVTISMNGKVKNAGGIHLSLSYDETAFSYTTGSRKLLLSTLSSSSLNREATANGVIHFTGDATSGFDVSGDIVSYQFSILSSQAGEQSFRLEVVEFYYLDSGLSSVKLASKESSAVISLTDASVQKVTNMIDAIGTVTLESETKIQEARAAYNALNIQQKRNVKNLSILADAESRLAILKAQASGSKDEKAAATFCEKYADILAETVQTLSLEDEQSVLDALNDLGNQELNVQILLNSERNHLKRLETRIGELKKIQQDALAEEKLKKEAQELVADFKKQWKDFLALEVEDVSEEHLMGVTQALGSAESTAMINSYFMEYIEAEYEHLLSLKNAIANAVNGGDSNAAMDKFQSNFGYLLNMKPEDVTRAEETDVRAAIIVYDMLSEEAKALIGSDAATKLAELLSAIEALPIEDGYSDVTAEPQIVYKDRVVEKTVEGENGKSLVKVSTQGIHSIVWWLLITLCITMILSAFAAVLLAVLNKKCQTFGKKGEELC